ncbi:MULTISPECIES: penicillin acylase family protein [unclassified Pseudoalteromonas]|uniref:penicillin acylase family protein n=1 Tax=unclassified Pseudoalteromonas TaxID=194690 RepID=UPI0025B382F8|nr:MULTISPECIES: penicillin acylase family protein [unclassified Pseudoalteromonas]MDN3394198.1 penicillin acylase family protein [Pseudoalteromonas sp. APC 3215]MDN3431759.1 penicillin acylase family protein [Pseudoalteromonas sp. APC 3907]MDN3465405.1 penicillin acylase family protein [Pseudoalteromonas sp. APC 3495]MDN3470785.1 penicillin acylase family protein [Pseudoalteromonas sp. APC 4026]
MKPHLLSLCIASSLLLIGCSEDNDNNVAPPIVVVPDPVPDTSAPIIAFDDDNKLDANIRWTTFGVPHITADNLESLAFGSGYAYAKDHACLLMDQIIKVRGERSKYYGPDKVPGSGDSTHLISDFGYKALGVNEYAQANYDQLEENSRAHFEGFVQGFNKYVTDTGVDNLAPECASAPWVTSLTAQDMLAYSMATVQLASSANFLELAFLANPGDANEYLPMPTSEQPSAVSSMVGNINQRAKQFKLEKKFDHLGSNGWGLGKDMMANGKGGLLANPHFPHEGNLRFWQSHLTIPNAMNVMGGSLQGMPGVINIGFNEHIAWTHTFSTARHFLIYQLALNENDRMGYSVEGDNYEITSKTINVEVTVAPGTTITLSKPFYYSHHGLMIETPAANGLGWNDSQAFTIKDANEFNMDVVAQWSAINQATSLEEMKASFAKYDGVSFNNTMASDKEGNVFFVDDSTVLKLSDTANMAIRLQPELVALRESTGFDLVPGNLKLFEPQGVVPFEQAPQLSRTDYVQNSNDSYWVTNLEQPLVGFAAQYGDVHQPLSLRTRMGLKLIKEGGGEDSKFDLAELENALVGNRIYLGELVFDDLVAQCKARGATPVTLTNGASIDLTAACAVLEDWNGAMNLDTQGAALIREFAHLFNGDEYLYDNFDVTNPANTPNTLLADGSALTALAHAVLNLQSNGVALNSTLGELQFVEKTLAGGIASGEQLPWSGPMSVEGGFNVYRFDRSSSRSFSTVIPYIDHQTLDDAVTGKPLASNLTASGYPVNYGSSWMFVMNFTDDGPVAKGLLTMSQSSDSSSEHFDDQSRFYSNTPVLRPILFKDADINLNLINEMDLSISKE